MIQLSKEIKKNGLLIIGIIIGLIHLKTGLEAIFVMTDDDHLALMAIVLLGPLLTLPAVLIYYFKPRAGGILLILGSISSLIIVVIYAIDMNQLERILSYVIKYFTPMIMLGFGALYLNKKNRV